jgi:hypothetical protein
MATKLVGFRIDEELFKKLKHAAVDEDTSLQELLKRAAEEYLKVLSRKSRPRTKS